MPVVVGLAVVALLTILAALFCEQAARWRRRGPCRRLAARIRRLDRRSDAILARREGG